MNDSMTSGEWPVGTLVTGRPESDDTDLRLVIGYKPDGRCMTVTVSPPWVNDVSGEVYLDRPGCLHRAQAPWASLHYETSLC